MHWFSDLHELNKVVLRKQYPLPIIQDILKKSAGYSFFTKIDILMKYYTFELDEESKDLTTDSNVPLTLPKKPWKTFSEVSKTQKSK